MVPSGKEVLHACDFGLCGNPAHLFLGTQMDNVDDMLSKGRYKNIMCFKEAKLTEQSIAQLWRLFDRGGSVPTIATTLGVSAGTVNCVLAGESWRRTSIKLGRIPKLRGKGNYLGNHHGMLGEANPAAKLSWHDVRGIRILCDSGWRQKAVAVKYRVDPMTVSLIVRGKIWKEASPLGSEA